MRSIGLLVMMLCAACPPNPPSPNGPAGEPAAVLEANHGDVLELSPKLERQVVRVREPSRVFVVQSNRVLDTIDVAGDGKFPRELTIPVGKLRDGSDNPLFAPIAKPGWELRDDDQCRRCMQCCPSPPIQPH